MLHDDKDITSIDNLVGAWREFVRGKRSKSDIQIFSINLMDNILALHRELVNQTYRHGRYHAFKISDPKPRQIHKASVRDRLVHHAVYRAFYPYFHQRFIADSYSCRKFKGTYKALKRFQKFSYIVSKNNTNTCWVLKCDIKKFFASIDQQILMGILKKHIQDEKIIWLLENIIKSFYSTAPGKGLPLGNLTSQLLVNIYMNEFDQFVKHQLKIKYYIRYADDFVIMSYDKTFLAKTLLRMEVFLRDQLKLALHPEKVFIKTLASGIDFLGWVHFPDHRVLRRATRRRMLKRLAIQRSVSSGVANSYLGLLKWGNTQKIRKQINLLFSL